MRSGTCVDLRACAVCNLQVDPCVQPARQLHLPVRQLHARSGRSSLLEPCSDAETNAPARRVLCAGSLIMAMAQLTVKSQVQLLSKA